MNIRSESGSCSSLRKLYRDLYISLSGESKRSFENFEVVLGACNGLNRIESEENRFGRKNRKYRERTLEEKVLLHGLIVKHACAKREEQKGFWCFLVWHSHFEGECGSFEP